LYRALDLDDPAPLPLLLRHGGNANEPAGNAPLAHTTSPLLRAIRRRRSPAQVAALIDAGADLAATTGDGLTPYRLALQFGLL
ncbi:hypothetical protein ABTH88_21285, partial [Acinetobacter baumannii]